MERRINKTEIEKRLRKKTNPLLVNTIIELKKENPEVARLLARSKNNYVEVNLEKLDREKDGEKILVPGKVLSTGNLSKKLKVVAWNASAKAREKIKHAHGEFVLITDEMKHNIKLNNLKMVV